MVGLDIRRPIGKNVGMFSTPRPRKLRSWEMNPWDVDVLAETEEDDVYCEHCDLAFDGVFTQWISGENVGTGECPNCERKIEVIPDGC